MTRRRTNLALLALLPLAVVTGFAGFAVGTPTVGTWIVVVHGVLGLAIVVLAPWKSTVIQRGLRRERVGRAASVTLAVLVVAVVATGLLHTAGLRVLLGGVTSMQVHVGAALLTMPLLVWHAVARPARPQRQDLSRRTLLRTATLGAAAGVLWVGTEGAWSLAGTRGSGRRFTGSHETGSMLPAAMPVTQWLFDAVPDIDPAAWRLRIAVPGQPPASLGLADLPSAERVRAMLDCTGGWWAQQDWGGVRLDRLVGEAGTAASVVVTSVTGYRRRFPVSDLATLWLATRCGDEPLTAGHGAPARLVAPGRRGFWWVKWVVAVELDHVPAWQQPPFPLQ